jgi:peptidoglycan hydrolase CwlO-like protein
VYTKVIVSVISGVILAVGVSYFTTRDMTRANAQDIKAQKEMCDGRAEKMEEVPEQVARIDERVKSINKKQDKMDDKPDVIIEQLPRR